MSKFIEPGTEEHARIAKKIEAVVDELAPILCKHTPDIVSMVALNLMVGSIAQVADQSPEDADSCLAACEKTVEAVRAAFDSGVFVQVTH